MTTTTLQDFTLSPDIILGKDEHHRLTALAHADFEHTAATAEGLLAELERALVVPDGFVPPDAVRMGSTVRYRAGNGELQEVLLTYPGDAHVAAGRISVLSPLGTALIGLRRGQSITWIEPDGAKQLLTVLAVWPPEGGEDDDDPGPAAA